MRPAERRARRNGSSNGEQRRSAGKESRVEVLRQRGWAVEGVHAISGQCPGGDAQGGYALVEGREGHHHGGAHRGGPLRGVLLRGGLDLLLWPGPVAEATGRNVTVSAGTKREHDGR